MKILLLLMISFFPFDLIGDEWTRVYLATYPRSGNHWARYLIEEAVHIVTGSVYPDAHPKHLPNPAPWGYHPENGYKGDCRYPRIDEPVVIKTHLPTIDRTPFDKRNYKKVIRIVRHPIDSIFSFAVFAGHPSDEPFPSQKLDRFIESWKNFQTFWDEKPNVMTFRYEDLLENPEIVLRDILTEIGYPFQEEDIQRAIKEHPPEGGELKHLGKYREEDLVLIRSKLKPLMKKFNYKIPNLL